MNSKQHLSANDYIDELNRRLKAHPEYQDGMKFIPHPVGSSGRYISGPSVIDNREMDWLYNEIQQQVYELYEYDPNLD